MRRRGNWLLLAGLILAGAGLLSCLLREPVWRLSPGPAGRQASVAAPAESALRLEIGRHSVAWDREGRWLVQVFDRSGGERLSRPLPRRGLGLSLSPGEGCQVVINRLPAPNCAL